MLNRFYTDFDVEVIDPPRSSDYRTPFQQDRDRVLHTSAFRRLQAKTQVFKSGEYDFYRTRLTHSIEVAQIGRSICNWLRQSKPLTPDFYIDEDLVEACCLAHDIGHPPFGHSGETSLNRLMRNLGGFEGNAQTLRLITQTIFAEGGRRRGMSPTRAFLDGILKYKMDLWSPLPEGPKGKFLYTDQTRYVDEVLGGYGGEEERNMKSIECEIMDWADDTAYCLGDLVDGVRAKFITPSSIERWAESRKELSSDVANYRSIAELIGALKQRQLSRFVAVSIGEFVQAASLRETETKMDGVTNRYHFRLDVREDKRKRYRLYHAIIVDLVFRTAQVQQLELKADTMLRSLFGCYRRQYLSKSITDKESITLLPADTQSLVMAVPRSHVERRARLICDHVAGMSDDFAIRTYQRLFEAGFGSIVDLV